MDTGTERVTDRTSGPRGEALLAWLLAPRDIAALVAFRMGLGLIVAVSAARFLAYGWVERLFGASTFQFKYWGFGWVPALEGPQLQVLFGAVLVLGLMMAAGLLYRLTTALLFLAFAYIQLFDVTNYLNHYYLVTLLLGLHVFIPSHRACSLDALLRPALRSRTLPAWCTYLLRFQVACVYVFAGLAKFTGDWLLHAQPLNIWLSARTSLPLVGPFMETGWVAYLAAWGGFLFDTTIVAFLILRRTRPLAYLAVLGFHAATSMLFPIGMFPFIMALAALVFFDSAWPRRFLPKTPGKEALSGLEPGWNGTRRVAVGLAAIYCVLQVALPLRTHLYGGNVLWHEQGMRFSWRVMAREKNGAVTFIVKQRETGREWHVTPRRYLTRLQEREMSVQPDLLLQLAKHIARDFQAKGHGRVQVFADALVSLNGRPAQRFIDPKVDLTAVDEGLADKPWILPAPAGAPIRLRPTLHAGR